MVFKRNKVNKIDFIFASTHSFTLDAFKIICLEAQKSSYTLNNDEEFSYIFKDLSARVFICSYDFFIKYEEAIKKSLYSIDIYKIICSDLENDFFDELWPKKMDMLNLKNSLEDLLKRISHG